VLSTGAAAGATSSGVEFTTTSSAATGTSSLRLQAKRTTEEITLATILLNIIFTLFL
jgi:hypothetical protein